MRKHGATEGRAVIYVESIAQMNRAALGKIVNGNGEIDARTTYYYAYPPDTNGVQKALELKITGSTESHNDS